MAYEADVSDSLGREVNTLCTQLQSSCDLEVFYATYFSQVVQMSEFHFGSLDKPICTLLAMKLGENVVSFFNRKRQTLNETTEIPKEEMQGLQYLSGYVLSTLLKKFQRHNASITEERKSVIAILKSFVEDSEISTPQRLIDAQTIGGMCKTSEHCQNIFIRVEEKFKRETSVTYLRKIDFEKITCEIMRNTDVVDFYKSVLLKAEVDLDKEVSDNLLEMMIKLYVRVRSFSLARDTAALYKQQNACQGKTKALRKNLKKQGTNE